MSKQSVLKLWMPALALVLLPLLKAAVVGAAPPAAPMLGFTPTPTPTTPVPPPPECDPKISKQVSPAVLECGDETTFTITVQNNGARATVNAHVVDIVPGYLEILGVEVSPRDQVRGLPIDVAPEMDENPKVDGQTVTVYLKPLSHGDQVTIVIRTKLREPEDASDEDAAGEPICVENIATFYTDNCGDPSAQASPCWLLPECGGPNTSNTWWVLAAGLATSVLALGLAFAKRRR